MVVHVCHPSYYRKCKIRGLRFRLACGGENPNPIFKITRVKGLEAWLK
jgi:hypothetical protein